MDTPTLSNANSGAPAPAVTVAKPSPVSGKSAEQPSSGNSSGLKLDYPREPQLSVSEVAAKAAEGKSNSLKTLESVSASIDEAVEVLNEALSRKHTSAVIRRDEQLNRFLVTIKDKESGEVVREIPSEALLKFARNLQELRGILFDETL